MKRRQSSPLFAPVQVEALLGNLLRLREDDSSIKCLVVSQFTRFLTILEVPLRSETQPHVPVTAETEEKNPKSFIYSTLQGTRVLFCAFGWIHEPKEKDPSHQGVSEF